jgi:hypothetical protein
MGHDKPYDEASHVSAEEGEVVVDGPDGVAVTLTPDAAVETSHRLLDAGVTAAGQRRLDKNGRASETRKSDQLDDDGICGREVGP